jgi:hypothetical protein
MIFLIYFPAKEKFVKRVGLLIMNMKKWTIALCLLLGLTLATSAAAEGSGTSTSSSIASFGPNYLIKADGSFWIWGWTKSVPTQIHQLSDVEASLGSQFVLKKDHSVWQWENSFTTTVKINSIGSLENIVSVWSLWNEFLAINEDGKLFYAKTNDKSTSPTFMPVAGIENVMTVDGYYESSQQGYWTRFIILKKDGSVWTSRDEFQTVEPIEKLKDIIQINQNLALKKDGSVWSWPVMVTSDNKQLATTSASLKASLAKAPVY